MNFIIEKITVLFFCLVVLAIVLISLGLIVLAIMADLGFRWGF